MNWISKLLICFTCLICTLGFAEDVELTLENGMVWKGAVGQIVAVEYEDKGKKLKYEGELTRATNTYIMVAGEFLFIDNITSITTQGGEPVDDTSDEVEDSNNDSVDGGSVIASVMNPTPIEGDLPKGVFVLPLHQMVGTYFRDVEITNLIEHIEKKYGLGQIIVLRIHSGGGAVHVWDKIRNVIFEARDRHRFIAWIQTAGSGAAATAFLCDEIYYEPTGYIGAITMYSGDINNVAPDWQMDGWVRELESLLARTSHTPMIAGSMVRSKYNFSYDIDPETGEFTYYNHEYGDHVLSKTGRNMMLSAGEALACGISDGTAADGEELAALLDLDEWIELDQYGNDMAREWTETLDEWAEVQGDLFGEFQGDVEGDTPKERIGNQIKAGEELLRWAKKLGSTGEMSGFSKENVNRLKRAIEDFKHQRSLLNN